MATGAARVRAGTWAAFSAWLPGTIESGALVPAGGGLAAAAGLGVGGAGRATLRGAGGGKTAGLDTSEGPA